MLHHRGRGLRAVALRLALVPRSYRVRFVDEDDAAVQVGLEEAARARHGLALVLADELGAARVDDFVAGEHPGGGEDFGDGLGEGGFARATRAHQHEVHELRLEELGILDECADDVDDARDDVGLR